MSVWNVTQASRGKSRFLPHGTGVGAQALGMPDEHRTAEVPFSVPGALLLALFETGSCHGVRLALNVAILPHSPQSWGRRARCHTSLVFCVECGRVVHVTSLLALPHLTWVSDVSPPGFAIVLPRPRLCVFSCDLY